MSTKNAWIGIGALALCLLAPWIVSADDSTPPKLTPEQRETLVSSLKWQTGPINLEDGLAKINLADGFRFLDSADARKVLHDVWGNPDNPKILGLIFPKDTGPLSHGGWAVTVKYEDGGYVKDDDAGKINYDDLLKKMQQQVKEASPARVKAGYPSIELVGWAAPPRYDQATHKLYWAKDLKFGDETKDTLNYDIRILGRRGVLVLTALGTIDQLQEIKDSTPGILAMVDFQPGNTYAEFDPKIDKIAEYGLTGLIAGGAIAAAAKMGVFGLLFKYGIAAVLFLKKGLILIIVAIVAGVKKFWGNFTGKTKTPDHLLPPGPRP